MDDFAAKQGVPNIYGLIQGPANAIGPGKRPLSAMTPTIVLKDGKLFLVLGSPGGPTIITTVANILIGVVDFSLDIQEAVNAPRFHHQWLPDEILVEDRLSPDTMNVLRSKGHKLNVEHFWGDGECIMIDPKTGERLGASDGRNNGKAVGLLMLRAVSTYVYVKERLHPGLLDELVKAGAQSIEIFAARQHFDYANRKQHVREIADWFRSTGIPLNSVHAPLYSDYEWGRTGSPPVNIASTDRAGRIDAMDEIKRALEVAEHIPFRFLVQHIGNPNDAFDEKKFEAAMTCVEHLRAFAKPLGVRVLLENIPNELSTPDRLVEFIKTMHFDDIGVCFDCGHAHMMGGIPEGLRDIEEPHLLDPRARQQQRQRLAPLAGQRIDRLETDHGIAAHRTAKAAPVARNRRRRKEKSQRRSKRNLPEAGRFVKRGQRSEVRLQR